AQPSIVENAKSVIPSESIRPPTDELLAKALATRILGSTPTDLSTPVVKITRAVREQITTVSMKTSVIPRKPCRTGWSVIADAWAIGDDPSPASFVKTPLATPEEITDLIDRPRPPPMTLFGRKASTKIDSIAGIRLLRFRI